jgi:hypothetical protein
MTAASGSLYLAGGPFGYAVPGVPGYAVTRLDAVTGRLTTVAGFGQGDGGFSPDGTLAAAALLGFECGIAVDAAGNLVLGGSNDLTRTADGRFGVFGNHRVRLVAARSGVFFGRSMRAGRIYTIAGDGGRGFGGDGGPALRAKLFYPGAVAVDNAGNVVFADAGNGRIRVIAARSGTFYGVRMRADDICTVAGSGPAPIAAKNAGPAPRVAPGTRALRAALRLEDGGTDEKSALMLDGRGDIVFYDEYAGGRLLLLAARTGEAFGQHVTAGHIYPIADLGQIEQLAVDAAGNVLAKPSSHRPRVIAATSGIFYGQRMAAGHSYLLPLAEPTPPQRLIQFTADAAGNLYEAYLSRTMGLAGGQVWMLPSHSGRLYGQRVSAGRFVLIAGLPAQSYQPASQVALPVIATVPPAGVPAGWAGDFVPAELATSRILVAAPTTGTWFGQPMIAGNVYAIAGNGVFSPGDPGDGVFATAAPSPDSAEPGLGVSQDSAGNVLLAGEGSGDVWAVAAQSGAFYGRQMTAGHIYSIVDFPNSGLPGVVATPCWNGFYLAVPDRAGNLIIGCNPGGLEVLAESSGRFYGRLMRAGHLYQLTASTDTGPTQPGIPASQTSFWPKAVSVDRFGNLIIVEHNDQDHVWIIAGATGLAYGQHVRAGYIYAIDQQPVSAIASDPWGNVLLTTESPLPPRVQVIAGRSGTYYGERMLAGHVYTIAGSGPPGFRGDGGPAARAALGSLGGIAFWSGRGLLVTDNGRLRLIYPPT